VQGLPQRQLGRRVPSALQLHAPADPRRAGERRLSTLRPRHPARRCGPSVRDTTNRAHRTRSTTPDPVAWRPLPSGLPQPPHRTTGQNDGILRQWSRHLVASIAGGLTGVAQGVRTPAGRSLPLNSTCSVALGAPGARRGCPRTEPFPMAVTCKKGPRWGRSSPGPPIVLCPGRTRQGPGPSGCLRQVLRTRDLD
jgi:hypothetical protein